VFGGYARYALTRPLRVLLNATSGERSSAPGSAHVGGNLAKQIVGGHTLRRLARAAMSLTSWRERYFANYARVEQSAWSKYFADPRLVSTARARAVFRDTVASGPQGDPATKAMYWDLQTYLPGLFQQDDRMSMAHSLESRVPFADPRVVSFAFRTDFDLKFRSGASKWILRRALADVLPEKVLNRRKAGFDTPAERWMRELHSGFVRETLLSTKASQRGIWETRAIEKLLANPGRPFWFDVVWKILSIEIWARVFLDGDVSARCQTGEAALPAVIAG
jgi:asparagine synthase (glutamine-hydrolysing)